MRDDHGGAPGARIDASVNCNPFGPPASLDEVFARARDLASRYPHVEAMRSREAWSIALGVPLGELLVGNGASELIALFVRALAPRRVITFDPCYSEYAAASRAAGAQLVSLPLAHEAEAWRTPLEIVTPRAGDLVVLGHPNNPTGHLLDPDVVRALAHAAPYARFLIDESFLPFHHLHDELSLVSARPSNVAVVRSLTKQFCVPGLRLGILVADAPTVESMRPLRDPWAVNGIAAEAAVVLASEETTAAIPESYLYRTREWFAAELPRAIAALREAGVAPSSSAAPYVLADLPRDLNAADLVTELASQDLAVRDASTFPRLGPSAFRLGLRLSEETDVVVGAIRRFVESSA